MSLCLESDLVDTKFDAKRQVNIYVVKRGAQHWTVEVPLSDLKAFAGNKMGRRKVVENKIATAMNGRADVQPV